MFKRIGGGILGGELGSFLCLTGFITAAIARRGGLFYAYLLAIGCFIIIVAEGHIDAPYRQLTAVPPLSVFVALGVIALLATIKTFFPSRRNKFKRFNCTQNLALPFSLVLICVIAAVRIDRVLWQDPSTPAHELRWQFSKEIRKHINYNSKLIVTGEYTIHVGGNDLSPVLYYYTGLQGWTLQKRDWDLKRVHSLIQKGATLFAAHSMSREPESMPFLEELRNQFEILYEDNHKGLLLLDLATPVK